IYSNPVLTLQWSPSTDASTYVLKVGPQAGCLNPTQEYRLSDQGLRKELSPLNNGTYFICLTAVDAFGNISVADNYNARLVIDSVSGTAESKFVTVKKDTSVN